MTATVLVVDDVADNRRLVRRVLEPKGMKVLEAETGEQALELVARERFDLMLLDLRLGEGGLTGFELVGRVRALPGGGATPVVALSGGATLDDEQEAKRAGFDGFILKPFEIATFADQVRGYLSRGRAG